MKTLTTFLILPLLVFPLLSQENLLPYKAKMETNSNVYAEPTVLSDELSKVAKGDTVSIVDSEKGMWKIADKDGNEGFVMFAKIKVTDQRLLDYRKKKLNEYAKQEQKELEKRKKEAEKKRRKTLEEKYGKARADRLISGTIRLDDTTEMVLVARGKPKDIKRSVGSWGVHEQWVYTGIYLYFENGKLKSWQD
jgi:HrpA-like RNA helicase